MKEIANGARGLMVSAPSARGARSGFVAGLWAVLLWVGGCSQGEGELCQVDSDCAGDLLCSDNGGRGECTRSEDLGDDEDTTADVDAEAAQDAGETEDAGMTEGTDTTEDAGTIEEASETEDAGETDDTAAVDAAVEAEVDVDAQMPVDAGSDGSVQDASMDPDGGTMDGGLDAAM